MFVLVHNGDFWKADNQSDLKAIFTFLFPFQNKKYHMYVLKAVLVHFSHMSRQHVNYLQQSSTKYICFRIKVMRLYLLYLLYFGLLLVLTNSKSHTVKRLVVVTSGGVSPKTQFCSSFTPSFWHSYASPYQNMCFKVKVVKMCHGCV